MRDILNNITKEFGEEVTLVIFMDGSGHIIDEDEKDLFIFYDLSELTLKFA